jgi:adenine-specific DNA-methyltransferase
VPRRVKSAPKVDDQAKPLTSAAATADGPDSPTTAADRPAGPGLYLHWDGRKGYRTRMPAPRVLEPVKKYSDGDGDGNKVIEGDNLQVMVSLRSQYRSGVDVAYLDPPYNSGKNDFRYSDKRFMDPNADANDGVYVSNEDGGRHTKWLNYMGPRLWLVWELLADHGVCMVSINDVELFRLGMLMDEIFGERNRLGVMVWKQAADNNPTQIAVGHEYILAYAKRKESVRNVWHGDSRAKGWLLAKYEELRVAHGQDHAALEKAYQAAILTQVAAYKAAADDPDVDIVDLDDLARYKYVDNRGPYAANRTTENPRVDGYFYDVANPKTGRVHARPGRGYRFPEATMRRLQEEDRIIYPADPRRLVQFKKHLSELRTPLRGIIEIGSRGGVADLKRLFGKEGGNIFPNPKPTRLLESLIGSAGDSDALVLDPFAGSGTTGEAVMRLNARDGGNRRFILIEEGEPGDRYARTVTAPRLKAAIRKDALEESFQFLHTGQRLNREAILELEREAVVSLIIQTDVTGVGRGIKKVAGTYIVGSNARNEAIALCWKGRTRSTVDRQILRSMFEEAKALGLQKPLRVYGTTCTVGETESFRFCQIPDEILAALQIAEEEESGVDEAVLLGELEALENAVQQVHLSGERR